MTEQPFFSVVIPTYARPQQLAACLDALAAVDFARDRFEVVVSDHGCSDGRSEEHAVYSARVTTEKGRSRSFSSGDIAPRLSACLE